MRRLPSFAFASEMKRAAPSVISVNPWPLVSISIVAVAMVSGTLLMMADNRSLMLARREQPLC
jgi:hypothetical protein